jgi:hypothetical protein
MAGSTYSSNLKIELMTTGENSGTWGDITNTNLGTALEQAIVGYGNPDYVSDANLTISITNSNAAQAARALVLNVTSVFGALTATRELVVPTIQKQYIVQNNTTGGQSITVKTSAGTGITVPNGRKAHLYVDGTNVIQMFDFVDINGGTIDGTPVGGSSAAAGAFTTLAASGATTLNGSVALGDAAGDNITFNGTVTSHLLFTDNTYDIGASGATRPRNLYLAGAATIGGNLSVGGTLTLTGGLTLNGNVTVGDSAADTLTINSTITSNLIFTDNTYDIGASGATRPRNLFLAGNATIGGAQTLTGALTVDSTTNSTSATTGSIQTDGGIGLAKDLYVGGSTTLGDASADTVTVNSTITSNLIFTDNTYDIGASGATRPRNMYLAGLVDVKNGVNYQAPNSTNAWYVYTYTDNTWRVNYNGSGGDELTLTTAGNFGIGTTTPGYKLDVTGSIRAVGSIIAYGTTDSPQLVSTNSGNNLALAIDSSTGSAFGSAYSANLWVQGNYPLRFWTNDTLQATLSTSGSFGLGTTSPNVQGVSKAFTVNGSEGGYEIANSGTLFASLNGNANGGTLFGVGTIGLRFFTSSSGTASERLRIDTSGQIAFGSSTVYNGGGFGRVMSIYDATAACTSYVNASMQYQLGVNSASYFALYDATSAAYRWIVDSAGGVGIGTSSAAAAKLEVIAANGTTFFKVGNASGNYINHGADGSGYYIEQNGGSGNTKAFRIQNSNGSGSYTAIRFDGTNQTMAFTTTSSERARFTSTGLFGIGTSSPNGLLDVKGGSIWVSNSTNDTALIMNCGSSVATIQTSYNTTGAYVPMTFRTKEQERMRIDTEGPLMINRTTYPSGIGASCRLMVNGVDGEWTTYIENPGSTSPYGMYVRFNGASPNGANFPFFYSSDTTTARFYVYSNGGVVNYQANNVNLSDRNEKTNFAPARNYLDVICAIPVQTFNYIDQNMQDDPDKTLGVVAQDVQAVAPELVKETDWSEKLDGSKMRLSIYQTDLQYALMKCIQELKFELDSVKAELSTLKGN